MHPLRHCFPVLALLTCAGAVYAQAPPASQQIAAAVSPAPPEMQEGAHVLGYDAAGALITLREGSNDLVCLADEPGDERFHVACYHASLEPFMARGRALRAEKKSRDEIAEIREAEIEDGTLSMPDHPAALYSLSGPADSFDAATNEVSGASPLYVIYIPFATAESTGLPTRAPAGSPWIMNPGKPWAHIMLVPPAP